MAKITGTVDVDLLFGTTLQDTIVGLSGDDYIYGDNGDDTVKGDEGNDHLYGGSGNDALSGGFGDDVLLGGDGDDVLSGSSGNDDLDGEVGDDNLSGGSGNDFLAGGAGNDTVNGGDGNDTIVGGTGVDTIIGGAGYDTLDYSSSLVAVNANLNTHVIGSAFGNSTADGIEKFIGSAFNDVINGDGLANALAGGDGNDVIRSRGGADILTGGNGQDTYVFMQKDVMLAGVHLGVDYITDFNTDDKIDVSDFFKGQDIINYSDVMQLTFDGTNTTLSVDSGMGFVDVVSFADSFVVPAQLLVDDHIILV